MDTEISNGLTGPDEVAIDWTLALDNLYGAVGKPELWQGVLDRLCVVFAADSALLFTPVPRLQDYPHHYSSRYGIDTLLPAYQQHFMHEDPFNAVVYKENLFKTSVVFRSHKLVPTHEIPIKFYRDFLDKYNMAYFMSAVLFDPENTNELPPTVLSLYRSFTMGSFSDATQDALTRLMPHMQRAWLLHHQLMHYQQLNHALQGSLNQLTHGVIVLDTTQKMQFANTAAKRFLSLLYLQELRASNTIAIGLPEAISRIISLPVNGKFLCKKIQLGTHQHLWMVVAPLAQLPQFDQYGTASSTVVWLTREAMDNTSSVSLMAELFKLTFSEAKVLELLLASKMPKEIAVQLNVQLSTVRSHLASLLSKTGARRQQDLIRMAATFEFVDVAD